ncbi:MAG: hypothetical protein ACJAWA_001969, partial [Nonlabens sp.]
MKYLFTLLVLFTSFNINAQELSGKQLLDKAIKKHDPNN